MRLVFCVQACVANLSVAIWMSGFCVCSQLWGAQVEWDTNIEIQGETLSPSSADSSEATRQHKMSELWACHRKGSQFTLCSYGQFVGDVGFGLVESTQGQGEEGSILGGAEKPQKKNA